VNAHNTENITEQVATLFARDPRLPRTLVGEITAVYWCLLLRSGAAQLPLWKQLLHDAVDCGIRTAELAASLESKTTKNRRR
jgi:hypothetical protein